MRRPVQVLAISIFLLACGGNVNAPKSAINPLARFISTETFSFGAIIDSAPLVQEQQFSLYHSLGYARDRTYAISTQQELDAFNQTIAPEERVSLANLEVYTYFFVRAPDCPEYLEYAGDSYDGGILTMTLSRFTVDGAVCPAVMVESYYVFKAHK